MPGPINLKQGGVLKKTLTAITSIIGANLSFDNNRKLKLTWRENERDNELLLNKPQTGSSHEIYINNSPLFVHPLLDIPHSELAQYYRVLPGIPEGEQFSLEYPFQLLDPGRKSEFVDSQGGTAKFESRRGSPTIPCQSVVLESPSNPEP